MISYSNLRSQSEIAKGSAAGHNGLKNIEELQKFQVLDQAMFRKA
jgi:peptidyl-tRNA hydrolase